MNEKLKLFKIEVDDIENIDFENSMLQKIARQSADEMDLKRFELVLNENIITAKDKFTGIHSYMGMRVSLESLEKDISFIVRPTNEPTYEYLSKENKQLKEKVEYLKQKSENKDRWCQLIADIGYDYDGYRKAEHLMKLIDELVTYALYARDDYDYLEWEKEGNNE